MSNTIEKALLRQKEAERLKKEAEESSAEPSSEIESNASTSDSPQVEEEIQSAESKQESKQDKEPTTVNEGETAVVSDDEDESGEAQFTSQRFDIDIADLESRGFVSLHSTRSQINEEYREIKRKLLANALGAMSST
jgi:protein-tyrosine kinase